MKHKKSGVRIIESGPGYIIDLNDGMTSPFLAVTQDELEEIVRQSLPYLRVPKGTAVNAFNKFMEKDKIDDFLKTNLN